MKTEHPSLPFNCKMVIVVLLIIVVFEIEKTKGYQHIYNESQGSSFGVKEREESDEMLIPVETSDGDFVVKFQGRNVSLISLIQNLHNLNITSFQIEDFPENVTNNKHSRTHSCEGRCYFEERSHSKTCYCDLPCVSWGDCCLDFHLRCDTFRNARIDSSFRNMTCEDLSTFSWTGGVIMKSSCSLQPKSQDTNECQTIKDLNMTLDKELPVFDRSNNVTYRSIACAKCNNAGNLSFWGLELANCRSPSLESLQANVTAIKRFLEENEQCSWQYVPLSNLEQPYKRCIPQDMVCPSNQLPVMSVIRKLCSSYSMPIIIAGLNTHLSFRNPHCALCQPNERKKGDAIQESFSQTATSSIAGVSPESSSFQPGPPPSILFDLSSSVLDEKVIQNAQPPSANYQDNLTSSFNCSSSEANCTVIYGGEVCTLLTSPINRAIPIPLNSSRVTVLTSQMLQNQEKEMRQNGSVFYLVCPDNQNTKYLQREASRTLGQITFAGTIVSIVSNCFLLVVYLSFKQLHNLPGKCLISLLSAMLCNQIIFLCAAKFQQVEFYCKAIAICLHFFVLASFWWMSVMAFDTANALNVYVRDTRRQASDIRKTFIKYCIVGWAFPGIIATVCAVLDSTKIFHVGYGNSLFCWISHPTAKAVAMVTPVCLALVFNAVCLTKSLYAIHRLKKGAGIAAASTSSRVSLPIICIKLTVIMGLSWILELIASSWQKAKFLKYPSNLLDSMQGFFITLCFITTKKVRRLLNETFRKRRNPGRNQIELQTSMTRYTEGVDGTYTPTYTTSQSTLVN